MIIDLASIKNKNTKRLLKGKVTNAAAFAKVLRAISKTEGLIDPDPDHCFGLCLGLSDTKDIVFADLVFPELHVTKEKTSEITTMATPKLATAIMCGHRYSFQGLLSTGKEMEILVKKYVQEKYRNLKMLDYVKVGVKGYVSRAEGILIPRAPSPSKGRNLSPTPGPASKEAVPKEQLIVGHFRDAYDCDNLDLRILSDGDISTIFTEMNGDKEYLEKIEHFNSDSGILDTVQDLAYDAARMSQVLSISLEKTSDFQDFLTLAVCIKKNINECCAYLEVLRDFSGDSAEE